MEDHVQISQSTKDAMDRLGIPPTEGWDATTTLSPQRYGEAVQVLEGWMEVHAGLSLGAILGQPVPC